MGKRNNLGRRRNIWAHQVQREKERLAKKERKKKGLGNVQTSEKKQETSSTNIVNKAANEGRKNNKRKIDEQQSTDAKDDEDVEMKNTAQPVLKRRRKVKRTKAFYKKVQASKSRQLNQKIEAAKQTMMPVEN